MAEIHCKGSLSKHNRLMIDAGTGIGRIMQEVLINK